LAVNVKPFVDGLGCVNAASEEHQNRFPYKGDCFVFPIRNDFGIEYLKAWEAVKQMGSGSRRISILLQELAPMENLPKEISICSPVYRLREETKGEKTDRVRKEMGVQYVARDGIEQVGTLMSEFAISDAMGQIASHDQNQAHLKILGKDLVVPLGLVKELWAITPDVLGIILGCDIILFREGRQEIQIRAK
jgi:hypothetical protein